MCKTVDALLRLQHLFLMKCMTVLGTEVTCQKSLTYKNLCLTFSSFSGSDAALEVSVDSGLDNMEASDADDGMCLDRESLFAEMMTQIEAAILRELQDHTQEEEPLDYEGDYDLDDIEQDHHVVICPICRYVMSIVYASHHSISIGGKSMQSFACRMYHMNIDCTAAHCQCGALIRLYKEDLGRSLDAAELKDMLKSAFDW